MSWITIVWSMNAAACLTLAGISLLVWCKQRENWVHLVFSASAVAAAAIAAFELAMMHCETVGQYEALVRWIHVPTWVLIVSFVSFVRLYLHAGRPWLAWTICGLRTLVLILNFIFTPNLNFRQITELHQFSWGGEIISVPFGIANPWGLLSSVSLLLLLIFFVDATITRLATRRSAARFICRRQHDLRRNSGMARPARNLGNHRGPVFPLLHIFGNHRGDGI